MLVGEGAVPVGVLGCFSISLIFGGWMRELYLQPARVELEGLFVLMGVDYGFCWAGGDWVEVGIGMGAHGDELLAFVGLQSTLL